MSTCLAVAAMIMAAAPASAASVVITPISATGFVHAANDGSASVDVTVCASFDQPVRFVEALVQFSKPIQGVAIQGPSGGAVTNWCGTVADLSAGLVAAGTSVDIDVSWSAHNGNGLSEGHAHSQGSFQIPGPAPVPPKKTPQQAADLGHASNAMWAATAVIAIGAFALAVASGGILAPALLGVLGGGVAAYMAAELGDLAIDPPDPNYTVTVVPHNVSLPVINAGNGISPAAATALSALRAVQEDETGQAAAMLAALYKAEGAAAAKDATWERTQTLAAAGFAHQLAVDLNSEPPLRSAARSALEAGGFPAIAVTQSQATDAQALWDSSGLPSALKNAITLSGVRPGADERLHALADSSSASTFVQQNVLDLLAPASPQAGPNAIEAANAAAATALLAWSDSLKLNPTGPPPPSPPIVTGVQPNQGVSAGGTTVNILGSNLLDTTQVNFGSQSTSNGSCSESQCTVISPAGTGTVNVTATGPGGTSAPSTSALFSYFTAVPGPTRISAQTLLAAGGFEPPGSESVDSFDTLVGSAGATKLGGHWEILAGSVDLVGPDSGQATEGVQFIDLNGNDAAGPGTISQQINTIPGHQYRLSFWLAGNPNGDPVIKTLTASLGATSQAFSFDTTGHSNLNLGWTEKDLDSLICTTTTRATLQTTTTGERGPNIDAVSVVDLGLAPADACISPVNHAPLAKDQSINTSQNAGIPITLAATDQDNDMLTYAIASAPQHGSLSGTAPNLTYTPASGYTGTDTFTFTANDGHATSNIAVVNITVGLAPTVVAFNVLFGSEKYNLTASSRTRLPWAITGIQITFSKPITGGTASSLSGVAATGFSGLGTKSLTWTFAQISQGSFSIALAGSGPTTLVDSDGMPLNGGAGFTQPLRVLEGDFNDDGVVSASDLVGVNSATKAPYNVLADLNGDGVVDISDVQIVRTRVGTSQP